VFSSPAAILTERSVGRTKNGISVLIPGASIDERALGLSNGRGINEYNYICQRLFYFFNKVFWGNRQEQGVRTFFFPLASLWKRHPPVNRELHGMPSSLNSGNHGKRHFPLSTRGLIMGENPGVAMIYDQIW